VTDCDDMLQVMTDPVLAEDGHTYERAVIERWFDAKGPVSMLSGAPLPSDNVIPNHAIRMIICSRSCLELELETQTQTGPQ
jgi:hypothetical protein